MAKSEQRTQQKLQSALRRVENAAFEAYYAGATPDMVRGAATFGFGEAHKREQGDLPSQQENSKD